MNAQHFESSMQLTGEENTTSLPRDRAEGWQAGKPAVTGAEIDARRAWRRMRKLELQRQRRQRHPRIDYSPSPCARSIIEGETFSGIGGDYSSVINRLIERAMR